MNKVIATIGVILAFVSAFFFLVVFSSGSLGNTVITGTNPYVNFIAFLFVIVFLPVGSGLAFYGFAAKRTLVSGAGQVVVRGGTGIAKGAIVLAILAIIVGAGAFAVLVPVMATQTSQSNQLNSLSSSLQKSGIGVVNLAPQTVNYRVEWYNIENSAQDRFNPNTIIVYQGDIVQILFLENDTDSHTFTLLTSPYSFQINDTPKLSHNFLEDYLNPNTCVNSTNYLQQSAGISPSICVSGQSLLPPGADFMAINPCPASVLNPPTAPKGCGAVIIPKVTNSFFVNYFNATACGPAPSGPCGAWGIGSFQASSVGVYQFICHYHVSNGMFGYLIVLPNAYCDSNSTAAKACGLPG